MNSPERFDVQPSISNHFSWIRTRYAVERTHMAWVRTAISLIAFGFTIVQFFQRIQSMPGADGRVMPVETPRNLGLALIATGIAGLGVSTLQYLGQLRYLWQFETLAGTVRETPTNTAAFYAALVLMAIGVAAFVSVLFRFP